MAVTAWLRTSEAPALVVTVRDSGHSSFSLGHSRTRELSVGLRALPASLQKHLQGRLPWPPPTSPGPIPGTTDRGV